MPITWPSYALKYCPASHLTADPHGVAAAYDVEIGAPAITAELSITLPDHFYTVMICASGQVE